VVHPGQQRWAVTVGLVVLAVVVTGLAAWLLIQPSTFEQRLNKFVITPTSTAPLRVSTWNDLAISPDGRHFVYMAVSTSGAQLYLRSLDDFVDRPIPGTEGILGSPFFSADGESVGFFAGGKLKKVSLAGGSPIDLCDATQNWSRGSWSSDGTIMFSASGETGRPSLHRVPAAGGELEILAIPNFDNGEQAYVNPKILPEGKALLFTIYIQNDAQTAVLSLDTGEQKIILGGSRHATYIDTGQLIYEQYGTGNLMAVPFDLASLEVAGDPVTVLQGVRRSEPGYVDYAVSDNGTLVYVPGGPVPKHEHSLVWVDRAGRETLVTEEKHSYTNPRISPDGKKLVLSVGDATDRHLSIYDFEADSLSRLTFEDERSGSGAWSQDGEWLVFQSGQVGGESGIVRQPVDRSSPQERLTSTSNRQMALSWSPDGQVVSFTESNRPGNWDIGILPLEGEGEPEYIIATDAGECCAQFSPDGKWLAYVSDELGRQNVYVSPFPEPNAKWLISEEEEGGAQPVWSPDGTELFYRIRDRTMVVSIQTRSQTLEVGKPRLLFEGRYVSHSTPPGMQYYDIHPDGQRFLMMKEGELPEGQGQINVILNWFEELKRLVPTN